MRLGRFRLTAPPIDSNSIALLSTERCAEHFVRLRSGDGEVEVLEFVVSLTRPYSFY